MYLRKVPVLGISLASTFISSVVFVVLENNLEYTTLEQSIHCRTSCLTASYPGENGRDPAALLWREEEKRFALLSGLFLHSYRTGLWKQPLDAMNVLPACRAALQTSSGKASWCS